MFDKTMVRGVLAAALATILLASASNAWAGDITYNIVDYPVNETDPTSATDTVSGTIITDGTIGPLSAANMIGGTFSLSSPHFDVAGPASFTAPIGLEATPTELLLDVGVDSSFSISTVITGQDGIATTCNAAGVTYENTPGGGLYCGSGSLSFGTMVMLLPGFYLSPVPTTPGSIGASSTWVIATVPEPASLMLLCPALLGFAAAYLRRRKVAVRRATCNG
ncbi:MAG: PEP-CTERM sorting domain-containing protein [Thermoguttaceae bacterium]